MAPVCIHDPNASVLTIGCEPLAVRRNDKSRDRVLVDDLWRRNKPCEWSLYRDRPRSASVDQTIEQAVGVRRRRSADYGVRKPDASDEAQKAISDHNAQCREQDCVTIEIESGIKETRA
jgi:hypothetical protein